MIVTKSKQYVDFFRYRTSAFIGLPINDNWLWKFEKKSEYVEISEQNLNTVYQYFKVALVNTPNQICGSKFLGEIVFTRNEESRSVGFWYNFSYTKYFVSDLETKT
jgi:hypothetical protein